MRYSTGGACPGRQQRGLNGLMLSLRRGNATEPSAFLVRTMPMGVQARARYECKWRLPTQCKHGPVRIRKQPPARRIQNRQVYGGAAEGPGLQRSQSFYIRSVASFEGKGHLEPKVRQMLSHCALPRDVASGREWHACSLQTALGAIGQAIDSEKALQ